MNVNNCQACVATATGGCIPCSSCAGTCDGTCIVGCDDTCTAVCVNVNNSGNRDNPSVFNTCKEVDGESEVKIDA